MAPKSSHAFPFNLFSHRRSSSQKIGKVWFYQHLNRVPNGPSAKKRITAKYTTIVESTKFTPHLDYLPTYRTGSYFRPITWCTHHTDVEPRGSLNEVCQVSWWVPVPPIYLQPILSSKDFNIIFRSRLYLEAVSQLYNFSTVILSSLQ